MTTQIVRITGDKENPTQEITVEPIDGDRVAITIDGETFEVEGFPTERGVSFRLDGRSYDIPVERRGDVHVVTTTNSRQNHELIDARVHKMRSALGVGAGGLKPELPSPMTGKVVLVPVAAGQEVSEGETLVIIEAMKMENEIKAPADTKVKDVKVAAGDLVAPGDVLLTFELE